MRVLAVGGGGREHAACAKLSQSPKLTKLFCAPGNAGIASLAECADIPSTDVERMVAFARDSGVDLCAVTSDDPLAAGMTDAMRREGIKVFGPSRAAARIESSKAFAKALMREHHIPTARFEVFTSAEAAEAHLTRVAPPYVVKADGLALGKGVTVTSELPQAVAAAREALADGRFASVVIEEYMAGREVTVMCFTDGDAYALMPPCRDHKRIGDGDVGPNTGGMGVISPPPDFTPELLRETEDNIIAPTLRAMKGMGCPFSGVLYFELMLTAEGVKVIEYNARFGDPEAQAVLPLLNTDLLDIMVAVADKKLSALPVAFSALSSAVVMLASAGYPGPVRKGFPVSGLSSLKSATHLFHSATALDGEGRLVTDGGRVLGVCTVGDTLGAALREVYSEVAKLSFEGMQYRNDIGKKDVQ
ncbi:MAG: phosphoribosylamine--glycine ligase [Oscillospiraceae bacterium]|jgi:phosphoribosylamine--glycine ligase|nr:phosphoribosylamine--glycine ligase [Oscillospiraceae bacterium]